MGTPQAGWGRRRPGPELRRSHRGRPPRPRSALFAVLDSWEKQGLRGSSSRRDGPRGLPGLKVPSQQIQRCGGRSTEETQDVGGGRCRRERAGRVSGPASQSGTEWPRGPEGPREGQRWGAGRRWGRRQARLRRGDAQAGSEAAPPAHLGRWRGSGAGGAPACRAPGLSAPGVFREPPFHPPHVPHFFPQPRVTPFSYKCAVPAPLLKDLRESHRPPPPPRAAVIKCRKPAAWAPEAQRPSRGGAVEVQAWAGLVPPGLSPWPARGCHQLCLLIVPPNPCRCPALCPNVLFL